ncbi:MAG: FAD-dependent oxidoreductase, partial [Nitrospirales bacterium]
MNSRVLIIGGGLSGLTTAFRLRSLGYHITLVDQGRLGDTEHFTPLTHAKPHTISLPPTNAEGNNPNSFPMVIHGFHHATWALLKDLGTDSLFESYPSVNLEFLVNGQSPIEFKPYPLPSPLHILIRLLLFKGMPYTDRWELIKKLEQLWEGDLALPQDLNSQYADAWMISLGQSEEARRNIWNPLCQFLLGTGAMHSSAQDLKEMLVQFFLSSRENHCTFLPNVDETTLLLSPLRHLIATHNIHVQTKCTATYFQYDSKGISGVRLDDGTTLTADIYISALPRKIFISCLPERLLAKYSYFSNLSQLTESPALVVRTEVPHTTGRPRLLLSANMFQWMTILPHDTQSTSTTFISGVALDNQQLLEKPDQEIVSALLSNLPFPFNKDINRVPPAQIFRPPHTLLSCKPNSSTYRPLQTSPIPNLFVVGSWTDTGLPTSRE